MSTLPQDHQFRCVLTSHLPDYITRAVMWSKFPHVWKSGDKEGVQCGKYTSYRSLLLQNRWAPASIVKPPVPPNATLRRSVAS